MHCCLHTTPADDPDSKRYWNNSRRCRGKSDEEFQDSQELGCSPPHRRGGCFHGTANDSRPSAQQSRRRSVQKRKHTERTQLTVQRSFANWRTTTASCSSPPTESARSTTRSFLACMSSCIIPNSQTSRDSRSGRPLLTSSRAKRASRCV